MHKHEAFFFVKKLAESQTIVQNLTKTLYLFSFFLVILLFLDLWERWIQALVLFLTKDFLNSNDRKCREFMQVRKCVMNLNRSKHLQVSICNILGSMWHEGKITFLPFMKICAHSLCSASGCTCSWYWVPPLL